MHAWCSSWIMNNIHGAKLKITCIFLFLDPLILLIHWLLPIQMSMHGRNADAVGVKKGWGRYGLERWPWIVAKITRHCRQFTSSMPRMHFWVFAISVAIPSPWKTECNKADEVSWKLLYASYNWTRNKEFSLQKKSYNWICARYWQGNMGVE